MTYSKNSTAGETAIQVFSSDKFGTVRTAGTTDNPLFCLTDVCKALALQAAAVTRRLGKDVISSHTLKTTGGKQKLNFVNEDGLYDVILDSRKPEAKAFRKWITSEVLPSIRKSGGYILAQPDEVPEQIMAKALKLADETMKRQQRQLESAHATIEEQSRTIRRLAGYDEYFMRARQIGQTYTMTETSEFLCFLNVTYFMDWCVNQGILHRLNGRWLPTDEYSGKGFFATRVFRRMVSPVDYVEVPYTVVTELGRSMLFRKYDEYTALTVKRINPAQEIQEGGVL
jgi:prophage antirepressor-like protein